MNIPALTSHGKVPVAPALGAAFININTALKFDTRLADATVEGTLELEGFHFVITRGRDKTTIRVERQTPPRWAYKRDNSIQPDTKVSLHAGLRFGGEKGWNRTQISGIALKTLAKDRKAGELATIVVRALEAERNHRDAINERSDRRQDAEALAQTVARDYGLQQHHDFTLEPHQWGGGAYRLTLSTLTASEVHAVTIALAATRARRAEEQAAAK